MSRRVTQTPQWLSAHGSARRNSLMFKKLLVGKALLEQHLLLSVQFVKPIFVNDRVVAFPLSFPVSVDFLEVRWAPFVIGIELVRAPVLVFVVLLIDA